MDCSLAIHNMKYYSNTYSNYTVLDKNPVVKLLKIKSLSFVVKYLNASCGSNILTDF